MAKKTTTKKTEAAGFLVVLSWGDKSVSHSGETILECLDAFTNDEVLNLGGKCFLDVKNGDRSAGILLWPRLVKRMLINKLSRELLQKRLLQSLK